MKRCCNLVFSFICFITILATKCFIGMKEPHLVTFSLSNKLPTICAIFHFFFLESIDCFCFKMHLKILWTPSEQPLS